MLEEKFYAYRMDDQGRYNDPVLISSMNELGAFILNNVEVYHELRVTDVDDLLVFHVKDRTLIHPLIDNMSPNNKWNSDLKKFVPQQ